MPRELFLCRDREKDEARVCPPQPAGLPEGFVQESREYTLELRGVENPDAWELLADGTPLVPLRSRPGTARWRWEVDFHAGRVSFQLRFPGRPEESFDVDTDPALHKLTRDRFRQMVREILE